MTTRPKLDDEVVTPQRKDYSSALLLFDIEHDAAVLTAHRHTNPKSNPLRNARYSTLERAPDGLPQDNGHVARSYADNQYNIKRGDLVRSIRRAPTGQSHQVLEVLQVRPEIDLALVIRTETTKTIHAITLSNLRHLDTAHNLPQADEEDAAPNKRELALPASDLPESDMEPTQVLARAQKGHAGNIAPTHGRPYSVEPIAHEKWYVYTMTLGKAVKIGYSHDPRDRRDAYNLGRLPGAGEKTWDLVYTEPFPSEQEAKSAEQELHRIFASHKTDHNNEVFLGVDPLEVQLKLAALMR